MAADDDEEEDDDDDDDYDDDDDDDQPFWGRSRRKFKQWYDVPDEPQDAGVQLARGGEFGSVSHHRCSQAIPALTCFVRQAPKQVYRHRPQILDV